MLGLHPEALIDPDRSQKADGPRRCFYSGKPTEVASGQQRTLFTSLSLQQTTADALRPTKQQKQTLEGVLTRLLACGVVAIRTAWDMQQTPQMHVTWEVEDGSRGLTLAGHASQTGVEKAIGSSVASRSRALLLPGCKYVGRASVEAGGRSGVEVAVGPQLQLWGRTCSAELRTDLALKSHLHLGYRMGSAPVQQQQDEDGKSQGAASPFPSQASLQGRRDPASGIPTPPQKHSRTPMTQDLVARALSPSHQQPRVRWGAQRRKVERAAVVQSRTSPVSDGPGGASGTRGRATSPGRGPAGRGRQRAGGKPGMRTPTRQARPDRPAPPPESNGATVATTHPAAPLPSGHRLASRCRTGDTDAMRTPLKAAQHTAHAPPVPLPSLAACRGNVHAGTPPPDGIAGTAAALPTVAGETFASNLPEGSLVVLTQRQGKPKGPPAPKNGTDCRLLLPIGPAEEVQYRVDVRRRLPLDMFLSADISTLGKQNKQICKLRLSHFLRPGLELAGHMQLREGALTQRGVRLVSKKKDGTPWQGSAVLDSNSGLRLNFKAGAKQITSPLLVDKGLLGRAAVTCTLNVAPVRQNSKLTLSGCLSY